MGYRPWEKSTVTYCKSTVIHVLSCMCCMHACMKLVLVTLYTGSVMLACLVRRSIIHLLNERPTTIRTCMQLCIKPLSAWLILP